MTNNTEQQAVPVAQEALCKRIFLHAHSDGWTGNQMRRDVQHVDAENSWSLYVSNGALAKSIEQIVPLSCKSGEDAGEIAGWQHALDPCPATGAKRWIYAIAPTEEQARRDGSGAFSNRPCDVRPLYTAPDATQTREAEAWQDIGNAPKDGTAVDLWKMAPDGIHGRRVPDCRWDSNRSFNGGIGRVALSDAWVHSHGGEVHCDGGELTHWRSVPDAPSAALNARGGA